MEVKEFSRMLTLFGMLCEVLPRVYLRRNERPRLKERV